MQSPVSGRERPTWTQHGSGGLHPESLVQVGGTQSPAPGPLVKCSFYKAIFILLEGRCFRKGFSSSLMSASKGGEIPSTPRHLLAGTVPLLSAHFNCQHVQWKLPLWLRIPIVYYSLCEINISFSLAYRDGFEVSGQDLDWYLVPLGLVSSSHP